MGWWREIAGLLGEFGGSIGRGIGTWTGFGLLEKEGEVLLKSEEEKWRIFSGVMLWNWGALSGTQRWLSDTPSGHTLFWKLEEAEKKKGAAQVEEMEWILASGIGL